MSSSHRSHYRHSIRKFREEFGDFQGICLSSIYASLAEPLNLLWPIVESYSWLVDDFIWSFHNDGTDDRREQLMSRLIEMPNYYVMDTATLVEYAEFEVVNQGAEIFGFAEMPEWEEWMEEYCRVSTGAALRKVFDNDIDVCLCCVDGSPWQIYSANSKLMQRLWDAWPRSQTSQLSDALLYFG